jgi:PEP-CTERM motif
MNNKRGQMNLKATALILMCMCTSVVSRASLLTNGGFETGDFSGWNSAGNFVNGYNVDVCQNQSSFGGTTCLSHSGQYAAALGPGPDGNGATLTQEVATTPGAVYTLTFYLYNFNDGFQPDNSFDIYFDGQTLSTFPAIFNLPDSTYQEYTSGPLTASSALTDVGFSFENTPGGFFLDDASFDPIPEPAPISLVLLALGLLCLGFRKRHPGKNLSSPASHSGVIG